MRHEFSIQSIQVFSPPSEVESENELTLEQKLMLANHPQVKQALAIQLEEQNAKIIANNVQTYQQLVQEGAELEAKKMGIKSNFQIFLHPDETGQRTVKIREGLIVHIHFDCDAKYVVSKKFWHEVIPDVLSLVPKLARTSALVVRSQYWEKRNELVPSWKKILIENEEVEFNLLPQSQITTEEEIKIVKRHKESGLVVIVSGPDSERESLEREAWILLSQQVALFNYSRLKSVVENELSVSKND